MIASYVVGTILALWGVAILVRLLVTSWPRMVRRWMLNLVDRRVKRLYPKRSELLRIRRLRGIGLSTGRPEDAGLTPDESYRLDKLEQEIDNLEELETCLIRFQARL